MLESRCGGGKNVALSSIHSSDSRGAELEETNLFHFFFLPLVKAVVKSGVAFVNFLGFASWGGGGKKD